MLGCRPCPIPPHLLFFESMYSELASNLFCAVSNMVFHNVHGVGHQIQSTRPERCSVPVLQDQPRPAGCPPVYTWAWYQGKTRAFLKWVQYICSEKRWVFWLLFFHSAPETLYCFFGPFPMSCSASFFFPLPTLQAEWACCRSRDRICDIIMSML